jgi:hypothetical protein
MFAIAEIDSEKAAAVLHGFVGRIADQRDIFSHHLPRRLTYDSAATLTYEGTILRRGGAEASIFHIAKPGSFLIIVYASELDEFRPSITVAGDLHQAEKFLMAFQMAGGAWI